MVKDRTTGVSMNPDEEAAIKAIVKKQIADTLYEHACKENQHLKNDSWSRYWDAIKEYQSARDNANRNYDRCAKDCEENIVRFLNKYGSSPLKYVIVNKLFTIPPHVLCLLSK